MKRMYLLTVIIMETISAFSQTANPDLTTTIIGLEKSALARWYQGDPTGFLDISALDVVYFDPYTEKRVDGLDALKEYYEPITGKVHITRSEMLNPKVQAVKEMAVLTFNLVDYQDDKVYKWNCTEVYRLEMDGKWKIVQTHWSYTKPEFK
jgi:hypothetical protein